MRKVTILLAVAIVAAQNVGCGCCGRMRDWLCRGAYCGAATPTFAAPAPFAVPPPAQFTAPMAATCPSCCPAETSYEPGCAYGAGMPMYGDTGWVPSGETITNDPEPIQ